MKQTDEPAGADDSDSWEDGSDYDIFMGRWSRLVAMEFVSALGVPPHRRWLDVGCGTGALLGAIIESAEPSSVSGVDPSPQFAAAARASTSGIADVRVGHGSDLPFRDDAFDAVVSGIALNFMPDTTAALLEWQRVATPGATISVYVWDYSHGMEFLRSFWNVAVEHDSAAYELDEATRFPLCRPEALTSAFRSAGFEDPDVGSIDIPTVFTSFADYWAPFTRGQGPAGGYVASLEPTTRQRLEQGLLDSLEAADDGSIHLTARAWTATATAPQR